MDPKDKDMGVGLDNDPLLRQLAELPAERPDDLTYARVRRRALAALAEERRMTQHPWLRPAQTVWQRAIMPTLLAGTIGAYLTWAVQYSANLY
ncbi:MAG TPA: hypothetical protein VH877_26505 [Polyangia bacterium]|jgi:hypothetical protein|nr:hypothetical protein [Polyangia bacterium]